MISPIDTPRLRLRELTEGDHAWILRLLNEPSFLRYIGDRGVRSPADARRYIREGPVASYREHGLGLFAVERREDGAALGICGLLRRPGLEHPDLGFALLPEHWSRGYAAEAARAAIEHGRRERGVGRLLAITSPGNEASIGLLGKLGFRADGRTRLSVESEEVLLFVLEEKATSPP